ncbi:MAG: DUF3105 domain-containing protein [Myxococcota bacterium]
MKRSLYMILILLGCGDSSTDGGGSEAEAEAESEAEGEAESEAESESESESEPACVMAESAVDNEGWNHVAEGSDPSYDHNPPASGPHYGVWARYQEYEEAVPRGYWVHNLEHGAVVFLYRPDAPTDAVLALAEIFENLPDDPDCGHPRALMTPDPELDDVVAIVAADWALEGDCVDEGAILTFVEAHRNESPEDVCSSGSYSP